MTKSARIMAITSYDDIFQTSTAHMETSQAQIMEIPLTELYLSENFPFKLREDAAMWENVESIKDGEAILPSLVRPRVQGGYEIVVGQRLMRACELAGRETMLSIVREMDDDTATIAMVNANLPQEKVLHSELAWALRMKLEALCHRGRKVDGIDPGCLSVEVLREQTGKSKTQIYRYVHLTELIPLLIDMVDDDKISFSIAADYLYKLARKEQAWLMESMSKYEATPSSSQAKRLKEHSEAGTLTSEVVDAIISEEKKSEENKVTLSSKCLKKYFPASYTPKQMEDIIIKLLDNWYIRCQKQGKEQPE